MDPCCLKCKRDTQTDRAVRQKLGGKKKPWLEIETVVRTKQNKT